MRKCLSAILVLMLLSLAVGILPAFAEEARPDLPPHIKKDVSVVAMYAGLEAQPVPGQKDRPVNEKTDKIDTVWIYYSDNTFDQYAEVRHEFVLFSTGTYALKNEGSFHTGTGSIEINRNGKYSADTNRLEEYASSHEYAFGSLGFTRIFSAEDGKDLEAVFLEDREIRHTDENGVIKKLDGVFLNYSDGSFEVVAFLNGEIVTYGSGTYQFDEHGDFHFDPMEENHGTLTLTWEESIGDQAGKTETYDLETIDLFCVYEKHDEAVHTPPAEPAE